MNPALLLLLAQLAETPSSYPSLPTQPPVVCIAVQAAPNTVVGLLRDRDAILAEASRQVARALGSEFPFARFVSDGPAEHWLTFRIVRLGAGPSAVFKEEVHLSTADPPAGGRCAPGGVRRGGDDGYPWVESEWRAGPAAPGVRASGATVAGGIIRQLRDDEHRTALLRLIPLDYQARVRPLDARAVLGVRPAAIRADITSLEFEVDLSVREPGGGPVTAFVWARGHTPVPPDGYIEGVVRRARYGAFPDQEVDGEPTPNLRRLAAAGVPMDTRVRFTSYRQTPCPVAADGTVQRARC